MYKVEESHRRPTYRNGDLEDEVVVIGAKIFKTRKEAKTFIERKLSGKADTWRWYHKGNQRSFCGYNTGVTWVHENTGETCYESYTYELSKV